MELSVSNTVFSGINNPRLQARRRQLKALLNKETELRERCKTLEADCSALLLPLKKVTPLPPEHPDTPKVAKLWQLTFDTQYNFINGNYRDYVKAHKELAKNAVENFELMNYVNTPIKINNPISIFSKTGIKMMKVLILDKFRIKTPEEKQYAEYCKELKKTKAMHETLGIRY